MADKGRVRLTVWSDYVCPFCYLDLPMLVKLKSTWGEQVEIVWRAFELRPFPEPTLDPDGPYLHRIWNASVYPMAEERGMILRLPPVQPRSRKAFEAAEEARQQGHFDVMHHALFKAFFEDGMDLANVDVLLDIAKRAGLDVPRLAQALQRGEHENKVLADGADARSGGVSSVPAIWAEANGTTRALVGARTYESLSAAVDQLQRARPDAFDPTVCEEA